MLRGESVSLGKLADEHHAKTWTPPKITLKQIRAAIPDHCFERNTLTSLAHVVADGCLVGALAIGATNIQHFPIPAAQPVLWLAYWIAQGIVATGLWVLAHECGHSSFSPHAWVNDSVGFVLHSALLVPFFSWRHSHAKHHQNNCHVTKDQVFVAKTRKRVEREAGIGETGVTDPLESGEAFFEDAPIYAFLGLIQYLVLGWPMYLLINASGQPYVKDSAGNRLTSSHFLPSSAVFTPKEYKSVVISNMGIFAAVIGLGFAVNAFGWQAVGAYYGIPYLFVNAWLVTITFLQHTSPVVPRFRSTSFVQGALATVDRDFGILNVFFHHITDTHVVHHLFSTMPFYHAQEATEAVKEVLGEYYLSSPLGLFDALWEAKTLCRFVEDEGDVVWFKH